MVDARWQHQKYWRSWRRQWMWMLSISNSCLDAGITHLENQRQCLRRHCGNLVYMDIEYLPQNYTLLRPVCLQMPREDKLSTAAGEPHSYFFLNTLSCMKGYCICDLNWFYFEEFNSSFCPLGLFLNKAHVSAELTIGAQSPEMWSVVTENCNFFLFCPLKVHVLSSYYLNVMH